MAIRDVNSLYDDLDAIDSKVHTKYLHPVYYNCGRQELYMREGFIDKAESKRYRTTILFLSVNKYFFLPNNLIEYFSFITVSSLFCPVEMICSR